MKSKSAPTGRLRRAFAMARVGARAGASWAADRGADAAANRTAEVLGNLRGIAAKVGQTASYVDGFIPPGQREVYRATLKKLQDATTTTEPDEIEKTLKEELGDNALDLFSAFSLTPVASASIGQVHRATLRDGTQVAVKVQHRGIEKAVESDLKNISMLEGFVNLAGPRGLKAGPLFDEILLRFRQELDYENEARNQTAFRELHQDEPGIQIPKVFTKYSTRRVLTSEWVDGFSLDEAASKPEALRVQFAELMWRFVFRGNLVGGAFNADPHPGNYIFHDDGKVTFLDFGCVQPISEKIRRAAVRAHQAAIAGNREEFSTAVAQMLGTQGGEFGDAAVAYSRKCFTPVLSPRFNLSHQYAAGLFEDMREMKKSMSTKDGSFVAPPPQLALMNRLQFGFYSVLAKLDVEVDYRSVEEGFLGEAAELREGLLSYLAT